MSTILESGKVIPTFFENTLFFYGGFFSQWYAADFIIGGVTYNTAEQYMMAMKADYFQDFETKKRIMQTKNPREQKALGRVVKNFNVDEWNKVSRTFVFAANEAKFRQNPYLLDYILSTGDRELVEASPTDIIWGIGLAENDSRIHDRTQWRGTNWLGEVLMNVRTYLHGNMSPLMVRLYRDQLATYSRGRCIES